jgi:hypothetical protein
MRAARHQRQAGGRTVKIGEAVADLDPRTRKPSVSQVFGHADVTMPATPEALSIWILRPFVGERCRVELDIWAEQLDDQRDHRRAGDEIDHRGLFQQARPLIEVIVFRSVKYRRLFEKGMRDPVARFDQSPHHFSIDRLPHDKEAIFIERSPLLGRELNEFHSILLKSDFNMSRIYRRNYGSQNNAVQSISAARVLAGIEALAEAPDFLLPAISPARIRLKHTVVLSKERLAAIKQA